MVHNNIAIANTSQLAGHVTVEDNVRIGGVCVFNQFITVGKNIVRHRRQRLQQRHHAVHDSPREPRGLARREHHRPRARGYPPEEVENVRKAVRIVTKGTRTSTKR